MLKTHRRTDLCKLASAVTLGVLLGACGGGDGSQLDSYGGKLGSNNSSSTSSIDTTSIRNLGYGTGGNFVAGEIGVGIGSDTLSAGGTTILTVNAVSGSGNLVTESFDVKFNSACIAANKANLSFAGKPLENGAIVTTNGQASVAYTADGCAGEDQVVATASYQSEVLSASTTLSIEADTLGSIQYVPNEETEDQVGQLIYLKGAGGPETARVKFLVTGEAGGKVEGACIDFSLNTSVGGLALAESKCEAGDPDGSTRAKSDANGIVSILVKSGYIATPIVITAKNATNGLSTQSRGLRIASGVPDQKSMSLSAENLSPEVANTDGVEVAVTIRLADAFNNPPIAGTSVSFTTTGGQIEDSCTVNAAGTCSVTWTSQNPRPENGLAVILAHTTGNESFTDVNGNGVYDLDIDIFKAPHSHPSCKFSTPPSSASGNSNACDDLPEAYLDANLNGVRDNDEYFVDFDKSNQHNALGDGIYNGVLCRPADETNGHCTRAGVTIRALSVIAMSSSQPKLENNRLLGQPAGVTITEKGIKELTILLADEYGNALPSGTKVTVDTSQAKDLSVSPEEFVIGNTAAPQELIISLIGTSDTDKPSGSILFKIETPKGYVSVTSVTKIN